MIRQAVSAYVARVIKDKTSLWHIYKDSERPVSLTIDFDSLLRCLLWTVECDRQMAIYQHSFPRPHLDLFYEDVAVDILGCLHGIHDWLGVPRSDHVDPMLKIVPENLRVTVANFDQMIEWLRGLTSGYGVNSGLVLFKDEIDEICR